jgi:hypothetical protein
MKIGDIVGKVGRKNLRYIGTVAHHELAATEDGRAFKIEDGEFIPIKRVAPKSASEFAGGQTHLYKWGEDLIGKAGQRLPFMPTRWAKRVRQSLRVFSWGGARPGAGRPMDGDEPKVPKTVTLSPSDISRLETLGDGNLSLGIRRAVERL